MDNQGSGDGLTRSFKINRSGNDKNRRDILIQQLTQNVYECMICYEKVLREEPIWYCQICYSMFHLACIHKWAASSADRDFDPLINKWRCPGCRTGSNETPGTCRCFCGRVEHAETVHEDDSHNTPHSCGRKCNRLVAGSLCLHPCQLLCHPGPCPPCRRQVKRHCICGKSKFKADCVLQKKFRCQKKCRKMRSCGIHQCSSGCHESPCKDCIYRFAKIDCHCGKESKEISCDTFIIVTNNMSGKYSCGRPCKRLTKSICSMTCHSGKCRPAENIDQIPLPLHSTIDDEKDLSNCFLLCGWCCCFSCISVFIGYSIV